MGGAVIFSPSALHALLMEFFCFRQVVVLLHYYYYYQQLQKKTEHPKKQMTKNKSVPHTLLSAVGTPEAPRLSQHNRRTSSTTSPVTGAPCARNRNVSSINCYRRWFYLSGLMIKNLPRTGIGLLHARLALAAAMHTSDPTTCLARWTGDTRWKWGKRAVRQRQGGTSTKGGRSGEGSRYCRPCIIVFFLSVFNVFFFTFVSADILALPVPLFFFYLSFFRNATWIQRNGTVYQYGNVVSYDAMVFHEADFP